MKAAVLSQFGSLPQYKDFNDPEPQNENQVVLNVKASSVKNLDKMRASGAHYSKHADLPTVVGVDGVGTLEDGTRVYAMGISGMIAEKALIDKNKYIVLPEGIDDVTAAALPNALMGSAMGMLYRGRMKSGETVLINGATGVTGKMAVQVAKYFGAKKIIVTGRNAEALQQLLEFGADEIISLKETDENIVAKIKAIHENTPIDIVVDYLWGHPVELILKALKGSGMNMFTDRVRIVTIGEMAGANIELPSSVLRSSAIEILGSGIGSFTPENLRDYQTKLLPEMFELAAKGQLTIATEVAPLEAIETAWNKEIAPGKRLVIKM